MSLLLRLDNDKPYGNASLLERFRSKAREDYWFPRSEGLGFMSHAFRFLELLKGEGIRAHWYFRRCTQPPTEVISGLLDSGQVIGMHAEDTSSFEAFQNELIAFRADTRQLCIHSFTKHGSGRRKLGRHHYPLYEPHLYRIWALRTNIPFLFGNSENPEELPEHHSDSQNVYFPSAYWIERPRRSLDWLVDTALRRGVVVLIHPENYFSKADIRRDFDLLLKLAHKVGVPWEILGDNELHSHTAGERFPQTAT